MNEIEHKAQNACEACRRLKRKCDRNVPKCSLCRRLRKQCQYNGSPAAIPGIMTSSPGTPSISSKSEDIPSFPFAGSNQHFPSQYFLDPRLFHSSAYYKPSDPLVQPLMSQNMTQYAPPEAQAQIVDRYFSTLHVWLPMVSRKRLTLAVHTAPEACRELLILAMHLCTTSPGQNIMPADEPLYLLVRSACSAAENSGQVSLRFTQTLVLVAVYEYFHAIFPAAYLTISRAARLAVIAGWHDKDAMQLLGPADSLALREEQRRTWWAIFMLDRSMNSNTKGLPFCSPEPSHDELLPYNDTDWYHGRRAPSEPLYAASFSTVTTLGPFARTCQAAHILSKVIQHKQSRQRRTPGTISLAEEGHGLHKALSALRVSLRQGTENDRGEDDCTLPGALAICTTARFILYNIYACRDEPNVPSGQLIALETELQDISVRELMDDVSSGLPDLAWAGEDCPLLAECFYSAAKICAWGVREDYDPIARDSLRNCVEALERMQKRWKSAGEFLNLLQQNSITALIGT